MKNNSYDSRRTYSSNEPGTHQKRGENQDPKWGGHNASKRIEISVIKDEIIFHANKFQWETNAAQYLELYRNQLY